MKKYYNKQKNLTILVGCFVLIFSLISPVSANQYVAPDYSHPHLVEEWNATYHLDSSKYPTFGHHAKQTPDKGYIAVGSINSYQNSNQEGCYGGNVYLVKTDSKGLKIKDTSLSNPGFSASAGLDLEPNTDSSGNADGYVIGAYSIKSATDSGGSEVLTSYLTSLKERDALDPYPMFSTQNANSQCFDQMPTSQATSVEKTSDGNYILAGTTWRGTGADGHPILALQKIGAGGNPMGLNSYDKVPLVIDRDWGKGQSLIKQSIRQTSEGGYIVTGTAAEWFINGANNHVPLLAKFDNNLNLVQNWPQLYHYNPLPSGTCSPEPCYSSYAHDVVETAHGYALVGSVKGFNGDANKEGVLLILTDKDGKNPQFHVLGNRGPDDYDSGYSLVQADDGGFLIVGTRFHSSGSDVLLIRTYDNGNEIYETTWTHQGGDNFGLSIEKTDDGGYIIAGTGSDDPLFAYELWLIKIHETKPILKPQGNFFTDLAKWFAHFIPEPVSTPSPTPVITLVPTISQNPSVFYVNTGSPVLKCSCTPQYGPPPLTVACDSSGSSGSDGAPPAVMTWQFGDKTLQTGPIVSHTYTKSGTYTITGGFKEQSGTEKSDTCATIQVKGSGTAANAGPVVQFTCTPASGPAPLTIQCDSSGSYSPNGKLELQWQFGDGTKAGGPSSFHTFTDPGVHKITLWVQDHAGMTAESTQTVEALKSEAKNQAPVAVAYIKPTTGYAPLGVALDGSKSYDPDGTIQLYRWDFGNGDYQDGPVIKRTFSSFGSYKIILTVTDDDGMTNSIGSTVTVNKADTAFVVSTTTPTPAPATNKAPVAIMSASPISGFAPMAVSFDASKSYDPDGKIVKYSWAFGKTSLGSGMVTSHTFTSAGSYIVTLYVTDDDGASTTATKTITVSDKRVLSHL